MAAGAPHPFPRHPVLSVELRPAEGEMPGEEQVYDFLREHYRADRFTGRDDAAWGTDYSRSVCAGKVSDLREHGYSSISCHDSKRRVALYFGRRLVPIFVD